MFGLSPGLTAVIALILTAEFVNGWHDAPNAIATVVSTRVMRPGQAVLMATVLNGLGAMSGTAVASTIGKAIVRADAIDLMTLGSATVGIILWGVTSWYMGLPTSSSHALVAGIAGASLATAGTGALLWEGWQKVLVGLFFSTIIGFAAGYAILSGIHRLFRNATPGRVRFLFGRLQIVSAAFMAFSHGSNDGQKFIGALSLALVLGGVLPQFAVPMPVILVCSVVMGLGTSMGGYRIIRTLGHRIVKLEPHQGFSAETGAGLAIEVASRLGIPLSTTHTISTAIMGVGATKRLSAVRWGVAGEIAVAWVFTFPICATTGFLAALAARALT